MLHAGQAQATRSSGRPDGRSAGAEALHNQAVWSPHQDENAHGSATDDKPLLAGPNGCNPEEGAGSIQDNLPWTADIAGQGSNQGKSFSPLLCLARLDATGLRAMTRG